MSIRLKIILTVLPLLISTLLTSGYLSSYSAEVALTRVAVDFLSFKAQEMSKNLDTQQSILEQNQLDDFPDFVKTAQQAVSIFASTLVKSPTELIFAIDKDSQLVFSTREVSLSDAEKAILRTMYAEEQSGWHTVTLNDTPMVGQFFVFTPWSWYVGVTESQRTFFAGVDEIRLQTYVVSGASALIGIFILFWFTNFLTAPIQRMVRAMQKIIESNDLSQRVKVQYRDEIGFMAGTFNHMIEDLERATIQIKNFALQSVIARKNEQKVRNIFQKYVPKHVIEEVFSHPEKSLVGQNRELAILFSDIRSFTTISESMRPDELVTNLNRYFSIMVDIITSHNGFVDKYIGDAIMAFFGAPVASKNDALMSVNAALGMTEALVTFNEEQKAQGKVTFNIGIGINYGEVTIGNIGSDKKMDYTVIGDTVNLASRLEGLTKKYHEQFVISEFVYQKVGRYVFCRLLDKVAVKGKSQGVGIYTVRRSLTDAEKAGWAHYHSGLEAYYDRNFKNASNFFNKTLEFLPDDYMAREMIQRSEHYLREPPPIDWNGTEVMHEK